MKKGKKIKTRKDQIGGYENSKSRLKNQDKSWLGHEMKFIGGRLKGNQLKRKRDSAKLKKWADQQLNRNEELICVKEKALDKLRYCNIKMKRLKIKDARIRNNKMFQEDQGMFYRKTQGTKQLKGKVPRMEKFEEFWAGIWEDNTKTPK